MSGAVRVPPKHKLTTTERGYGAAWRKVRLAALAREPLCRFCYAAGAIVKADEVDHIDGDSFNNDPDNLRPLCRPCHLLRTARDQAFGKYQFRPEWLRPAAIPVTIVCGAPCSGKSSYVARHAAAEDLVIDLDVIASTIAQSGLHDWDRKWLGPAIRERNRLLGELTKQPQCKRAWLILSEASPDKRQWWADTFKPERIVVLETPPAVCMARAKADGRRVGATREAIGKWWSAYGRRSGDEVVSGGV